MIAGQDINGCSSWVSASFDMKTNTISFLTYRLISLGSNESALDTKFDVRLVAVDQHAVAVVAAQPAGLLPVPNATEPAFRRPYAAALGPNAGQLPDALAGVARPLVLVIAEIQLRLERGRPVAGGQ